MFDAPEKIEDSDMVSRLVFFPHMEGNGDDLIAPLMFFEFPQGQPESVVWRQRCLQDSDVHALGCAAEAKKWEEAKKRGRTLNDTYKGFRSALAGVVRACRSRRGHGFHVEYAPKEGVHHAEISYAPNENPAEPGLRQSDKQELRLYLHRLFSPLSPHSCSSDPIAIP